MKVRSRTELWVALQYRKGYSYYGPDNKLRISHTPPVFKPERFPEEKHDWKPHSGDLVQRGVADHGVIVFVSKSSEEVGVKFFNSDLETIDLACFDGNYVTMYNYKHRWLLEA